MATASAKTTSTEQTGPPWLIKNIANWPGAFGAYKYSQSAVMLNLAAIIILFIISIVASSFQQVNPTYLFATLSIIVSFLIYIVQYKIYLAGAKGNKLEIGDAFKESFNGSLILNMIGLAVICGAVVTLGFVLFIIPGLIILPRLILAPYFLLDQKLDCVEAFKASWNGTKGHSWKVWGLVGAAFVMILPVLTIIGIPVTIYLLFMYGAVGAVLYEYIKKVGPAKS